MRQIVLVRNIAVFHQHHDGVGVGSLLDAGQPSVVRNPADTDLGGIHEIGVALDVGRPAVEIVGNGRLIGGHLVIHELGENRSVVVSHMGEIGAVGNSLRSRFGGRPGLHRGNVIIAWKRFQRKQAVVKRPVPGSSMKYH